MICRRCKGTGKVHIVANLKLNCGGGAHPVSSLLDKGIPATAKVMKKTCADCYGTGKALNKGRS